ncbi:MAG: adenine nucleotide alpha hydrolase family protein [Thermoplasmata archaeon]|nr:adenine nucleotide alpha hydrolase family protein [Thermoplasmata archaeon]
MKCKMCGGKAEIRLRAYRIQLCKNCFRVFYERRVEDDMKKYRIVRNGERICVALSGGKDSIALIHVLNKLKDKFKISIEALHLDLGIGAYSSKAESICREVCQKLDIKLNVVRLSDYGFRIEDVDVKKVCSVCGNAKRYLMNRFTRENGFDALATGHNADDILTNFFKNWIAGNMEWIDKQRPRTEGFDKIVTRIRPLFLRTDQENSLYVESINLPALGIKCPYAVVDKWRRIIDDIEKEIPGFKQNFVRNMFKERKKDQKKIKHCSICGEVSNVETCQFCRNVMRFGKGKIKH